MLSAYTLADRGGRRHGHARRRGRRRRRADGVVDGEAARADSERHAPADVELGRAAGARLLKRRDARVGRWVLVEERAAPLDEAELARVRALAAAGGPHVQRVLALSEDRRSVVYEWVDHSSDGDGDGDGDDDGGGDGVARREPVTVDQLRRRAAGAGGRSGGGCTTRARRRWRWCPARALPARRRPGGAARARARGHIMSWVTSSGTMSLTSLPATTPMPMRVARPSRMLPRWPGLAIKPLSASSAE